MESPDKPSSVRAQNAVKPRETLPPTHEIPNPLFQMNTPVSTGRLRLSRFAGQVTDSLERHFWQWTSLLLMMFLACLIARDLRSKLWIDELFTLYDAKQANPAEIVRMIAEGSDQAPPLYAILVQGLLPVVRSETLAVRLPSTIGFCAMVLGVLIFARRRMPAIYSYIGALLVCDVCLYYSTEGRAYGLVLGCAAGALVFWQLAVDGCRRALFIPLYALCLSGMVASHYHSIFFLVPMFAAELARTRKSGKADFGTLSALIAPVLVLALHYPLISATGKFFEHFWSHAHLGMIATFYDSFFFTPYLYLWPLALITLAVLPESGVDHQLAENRMPAHEWIAIAGLALMPPFVVVASELTTHVFVDRYILWSVVGIGLTAAALLCKAVRGNAAVGIVLTGALAVLLGHEEFRYFRTASTLRFGEAILRQLETMPDGPERIVVPNARVYMELSYYADSKVRDRLIYPVNRELDLRYKGFDTDALLMAALGRRVNLNVQEYDEILSRYSSFIVAANPNDYLPSHMKASGFQVNPIRFVDSEPVVFRVEAPNEVRP
jgi:hypothetical protein